MNEFIRHNEKSKADYVTIIVPGQIHLNKSMCELFGLLSPEPVYAILFFNEKKKQIAVEFTNNDEENGIFDIKKRMTMPFGTKDKYIASCHISCYRFLRINGLLPEKRMKLKATKQEKYLIIDTNEEDI